MSGVASIGFVARFYIRSRCRRASGYSFKNTRIPKFKEAIELCVALHNKVPHFTIIGWDATIDNADQIKIMEWNSNHPDIKFSEATTGPCFMGLNWEMYAKTK